MGVEHSPQSSKPPSFVKNARTLSNKEARKSASFDMNESKDKDASIEKNESKGKGARSKTPPTTQTQTGKNADKANYECGKCRTSVKNNQKALQCDNCDYWIHIGCEDIKADEYNKIKNLETPVLWMCKKCNDKRFKLKEEHAKLKKDYEDLKEEYNLLRDKLDSFDDKIEHIKTDIKAELKHEIKQEIRLEQIDDHKDEEDRKQRECNLILHGMPESKLENAEDQECEDGNNTIYIFKEELQMTHIDVEKVIRLGNNNPNNQRDKPRPLLVKVRTPGQKWGIIKYAKKLKQSQYEELRTVYIVPDLSIKDREKDRKIRLELKEKRERGEEGWYISKGQLRRQTFLEEEKQ